MNENASKRREWVKNAAIIFLSIMLVLTFFSNTIMNYSLPEVATKFVEQNTITAKIRGTGNVEATDPYTIKVTESRVISGVAVEKGDEVEIDDVLYYLEDSESEELKKAQEELDAMVLAYMQQLFDGTTTPTVINKVENGNTDSFNTYKAKVADIQNRIKAAENAVANNNTAVENLNKQIALLENSASSKDTAEEQKAVTDATQTLQHRKNDQTNAQNSVTEVENRIKELEAQVAEAAALADITQDSSGNPTGGIQDYINAVSTAKAAIKTYLDDVITKIPTPSDVLNEADVKSALEKEFGVDSGGYKDSLKSYNELVSVYNATQAVLATAHDTLNQYNYYVNKLAEKESELAKAKNSLSDAEQNVRNAENSLANAELILSNKEKEEGDDSAKQSLNKQLIEAKSTLALSETNLELIKAEQVTLLANIQAELDLENKNSAIAEKREEIEKLIEKSEGAAIKAPVAGTVVSLNYVAGETMKLDEEAAVIQVAGKGFTVSFSVTNEQAAKVQVGDVAELQNAWYYNDVKVVLASIKPDPDNPGKNKLLTFDISGNELQAGEALNLSVGQRSQQYELVVPNSAIREDNNGKFVLLVESKNSPLGNRYVATRVDVEVLASDDNNTAISGALYGYGEYVITTATKPVEAGKQVRLAD